MILGSPTAYGYYLPRLRYNLSRQFYPNIKKSLLDFGCGNGANTILFSKDFQSVTGVEVEQERLKEANAYLTVNRLSNVKYLLYDGLRLPFDDNTFDFSISFEVLEHTENDQDAIREMWRTLKNGGRAIITVPNKWYLMETHGFNFPLQHIVPWNRVPFLSWLPETIHQKYAKARIYTKSRILEKLTASGFTIMYHRYIMPPFDKVKNKNVQKILKGIYSVIEKTPLDFLGVAHFIVVEKI